MLKPTTTRMTIIQSQPNPIPKPYHRPIPACRPAAACGFASSRPWRSFQCRSSLPLDAIRRTRDTPIWKLEAALKCRSCRKGRYAPPVHMIKLTATQEITPYQWVHPDEER